jgi:CubicO group peptidase (beta-lactamase class C family)
VYWEAIVRQRLTLLAVTCAAIQCLVVFAAVAGGPAATKTTSVFPGKEWEVSTPEKQGMDSARLARLVENVGAYRYDSLTIVRHGRIVVDVYYAPYLPRISHDLRSVTKSVIGTLTAIEIAHGLLDSVDHKVLDLFHDKQVANIDDNKRSITVRTLLDMTSGIAWTEKSYTHDETIMRLFEAPDPTAFVLDQPMASVPGTQFAYNGGNPYLLSAIINRKAGQNAFNYAKKNLFGPLGITSARWPRTDKQGVTDGESGLSLSSHDMARIGYLYLRNGNWNGHNCATTVKLKRNPSPRREAFSVRLLLGRVLIKFAEHHVCRILINPALSPGELLATRLVQFKL